MKRPLIALLFIAAMAVPAGAQQINIDIPGLGERAAEEVTVTLDARMLRLAAKFFSDKRDDRAIRDMVQNLTGVYVRSYEFDKEGEYDRSVTDRVRSQLGAGWQKIVDVRSRRARENSEIFVYSGKGEQITGLVVITAEPRELTIVNIVGPIDLDRLASMEGQFGIPKMTREGKEKEKQ